MNKVRNAVALLAAAVLMVGCTIDTSGYDADKGGNDTKVETEVDDYAILQLTWEMLSTSEQRELCNGWNNSTALQDVMVESFIDGYQSTGTGSNLSASELESLVRRLMGDEC